MLRRCSLRAATWVLGGLSTTGETGVETGAKYHPLGPTSTASCPQNLRVRYVGPHVGPHVERVGSISAATTNRDLVGRHSRARGDVTPARRRGRAWDRCWGAHGRRIARGRKRAWSDVRGPRTAKLTNIALPQGLNGLRPIVHALIVVVWIRRRQDRLSARGRRERSRQSSR
jgi:hypothetical protein